MKKLLLCLSCLVSLLSCGTSSGNSTNESSKYKSVESYENVYYSFTSDMQCSIRYTKYVEDEEVTLTWLVYLTGFYVDYNYEYTYLYVCTRTNNNKDYYIIKGRY